MALHFYLSSEESDVYEDTLNSEGSSSNKKKSGESFQSFAEEKRSEASLEFDKRKKEKKRVNFAPETLFKKETRFPVNEVFWMDTHAKKKKFNYSEPVSSGLSESDFETNSEKSCSSSTDSMEQKLKHIQKNSFRTVEDISLNRREIDSTSSESAKSSLSKENGTINEKILTKNISSESDTLKIFDELIEQNVKEINIDTHSDEGQNELNTQYRDEKITYGDSSSGDEKHSKIVLSPQSRDPSNVVKKLLDCQSRIDPVVQNSEQLNEKGIPEMLEATEESNSLQETVQGDCVRDATDCVVDTNVRETKDCVGNTNVRCSTDCAGDTNVIETKDFIGDTNVRHSEERVGDTNVRYSTDCAGYTNVIETKDLIGDTNVRHSEERVGDTNVKDTTVCAENTNVTYSTDGVGDTNLKNNKDFVGDTNVRHSEERVGDINVRHTEERVGDTNVEDKMDCVVDTNVRHTKDCVGDTNVGDNKDCFGNKNVKDTTDCVPDTTACVGVANVRNANVWDNTACVGNTNVWDNTNCVEGIGVRDTAGSVGSTEVWDTTVSAGDTIVSDNADCVVGTSVWDGTDCVGDTNASYSTDCATDTNVGDGTQCFTDTNARDSNVWGTNFWNAAPYVGYNNVWYTTDYVADTNVENTTLCFEHTSDDANNERAFDFEEQGSKALEKLENHSILNETDYQVFNCSGINSKTDGKNGYIPNRDQNYKTIDENSIYSINGSNQCLSEKVDPCVMNCLQLNELPKSQLVTDDISISDHNVTDAVPSFPLPNSMESEVNNDVRGMAYHVDNDLDGIASHKSNVQNDYNNDLNVSKYQGANDSELVVTDTNVPKYRSHFSHNHSSSDLGVGISSKSCLGQDSGLSFDMESEQLLKTSQTVTTITDAEMLAMCFGNSDHSQNAKGDPLFQEAVQSLDEESILSVLNEKSFLPEIDSYRSIPASQLLMGTEDHLINKEYDKYTKLHFNVEPSDQKGEPLDVSVPEIRNTSNEDFEKNKYKSVVDNIEITSDLMNTLYRTNEIKVSPSTSEEDSSKEGVNFRYSDGSPTVSSVHDHTETEILRNLLLSSSFESNEELTMRDQLASREATVTPSSGSDGNDILDTAGLDSFSQNANGATDFVRDTLKEIQDKSSSETLDSIASKRSDPQATKDELLSTDHENQNDENKEGGNIENRGTSDVEGEKQKREFLSVRLSKLRQTLSLLKQQLLEERQKNKAEAAELAMLTRRVDEARQLGMMMEQVGKPALGWRSPTYGWGQAELVREQIRAKRMVAALEFKNMLEEVEAKCFAEWNNLENAIEELQPLNRMASYWLPSPSQCTYSSSSWMRRDFFMEVTRSMNLSSSQRGMFALEANESQI